MATETKLQKLWQTYFASNKTSTKIASFFKTTKQKECNNEIIHVGASVFVFVYGNINLQHDFSINNHQ